MQGSNQTNIESSPSLDYWQILKNRYGVILLTFLLVFMTAAVITSVIPEKYESTSVVQVHPSTIAITPFRGQSSVNPGSNMTAQYLQNEFETIIAPETLKKAAQMAQLPAQWEMDMDAVVSMLEGIVETTPRRGTDFIEINVRHASASDAKDIAEAVAEAYAMSPHAFFVGGVALILAIQVGGLGILSLQNKRYFDELFKPLQSI